MSPHLRPAQPADIPALQELIERSGRGLSAPFYTPEQAEAVTRHVFGVDSQLIADQTYFVIEEDGAFVACGGWSRRRTLFGGDQTKSGEDPLLDPASEPVCASAASRPPSDWPSLSATMCLPAARAMRHAALNVWRLDTAST